MRSRYATMFVLISTLTLTGCASAMSFLETTPDTSKIGRASFCDTARPILWSDKDSDGTIKQIKEHNAVGKSLCGWGRKSDTSPQWGATSWR